MLAGAGAAARRVVRFRSLRAPFLLGLVVRLLLSRAGLCRLAALGDAPPMMDVAICVSKIDGASRIGTQPTSGVRLFRRYVGPFVGSTTAMVAAGGSVGCTHSVRAALALSEGGGADHEVVDC